MALRSVLRPMVMARAMMGGAAAGRRWASDVKFDHEGKVVGAKYSVGYPDLEHIDHVPAAGLNSSPPSEKCFRQGRCEL
jgi:hypothetical protein